ncbi:unnamed protein product [Pleuronectes platessa]|uniref:VWFD domain-containing protein n=1 Tax=Pleuronectes platessa TaxID=8262 RepID=A0A9N7ZF26_PLEPL|nr:unnamed protein product [Pleuronectes platessa]
MNGSSSLHAELSYLFSLGRKLVSSGASASSLWPQGTNRECQLGNIRITASSTSDGAKDEPGLWSRAHVLTWNFEQTFRDDSAAWAEDKCLQWDLVEEEQPESSTDSSCDIETGRCVLITLSHSWIRAVALIRQLRSSDADGRLFLWQQPRQGPPLGLASLQGTTTGVVFGDPHFITFDGLGFTFNSEGEFDLVSSPERELSIQARTERLGLQNSTSAKATWLSAVAMKERGAPMWSRCVWQSNASRC